MMYEEDVFESELEHDVRREGKELQDTDCVRNEVGWTHSIGSKKELEEALKHIQLLYEETRFDSLEWSASKIIELEEKREYTRRELEEYIKSELDKKHQVHTQDIFEDCGVTFMEANSVLNEVVCSYCGKPLTEEMGRHVGEHGNVFHEYCWEYYVKPELKEEGLLE